MQACCVTAAGARPQLFAVTDQEALVGGCVGGWVYGRAGVWVGSPCGALLLAHSSRAPTFAPSLLLLLLLPYPPPPPPPPRARADLPGQHSVRGGVRSGLGQQASQAGRQVGGWAAWEGGGRAQGHRWRAPLLAPLLSSTTPPFMLPPPRFTHTRKLVAHPPRAQAPPPPHTRQPLVHFRPRAGCGQREGGRGGSACGAASRVHHRVAAQAALQGARPYSWHLLRDSQGAASRSVCAASARAGAGSALRAWRRATAGFGA